MNTKQSSGWLKPYVGPFDLEFARRIRDDLAKAVDENGEPIFGAVVVDIRTTQTDMYDVFVKF